MKPLPLSPDVADLVGEYAENVENRSLLLEKFILPKNWLSDSPKLNDAGRWSLLRMSDGGSKLLNAEAQKEKHKAAKPGDSKNLKASRIAAELLPLFAKTKAESADAQDLRQRHARRFLAMARESLGETASVFCARLQSRMAINLSDGLIENAGISLDRLFGLPLIPGSALKGVTRHAALAELKSALWEKRTELLTRFVSVFGSAEADFQRKGCLAEFSSEAKIFDSLNQRGGVTFLSAHPVEPCRIEVDLANVHTPSYYTGNQAGSLRSLNIESPRPNPFPVVAGQSAFGFALALNAIGKQADDPGRILSDARRWIEEALTVHGIGAKTGAGYGWFALDKELDRQLEEEAEKARNDAEEEAKKRAKEESDIKAEEERIAGLSPEERAKEELLALDNQSFAGKAKGLADQPESVQRALLELLLSEKRDRWKNWKKRKPATKEAIESVAKKLDIELP